MPKIIETKGTTVAITADEKWYYDPSTKKVSRGKVSGWENRMGPYDTREEAERAIEIARARTKAADAADKEDDGWE
nr:hypothetical protein [Corynebacterium macginleyi]